MKRQQSISLFFVAKNQQKKSQIALMTDNFDNQPPASPEPTQVQVSVLGPPRLWTKMINLNFFSHWRWRIIPPTHTRFVLFFTNHSLVISQLPVVVNRWHRIPQSLNIIMCLQHQKQCTCHWWIKTPCHRCRHKLGGTTWNSQQQQQKLHHRSASKEFLVSVQCALF